MSANRGGESEPIIFTPSRELSDQETRRLAKLAGSLGLTQNGMPIPFTRQELLIEHVKHTYPESADSFVAKEHLWFLGEEVGIARRATGLLFTELCFPILRGSRNSRNRLDEAIRPAVLGLDVRQRSEVGLPVAPVPVGGNLCRRTLAHITDWHEAIHGPSNAAVQIKGVSALESRDVDLNLYFTPLAQAALNEITPRLREFTT